MISNAQTFASTAQTLEGRSSTYPGFLSVWTGFTTSRSHFVKACFAQIDEVAVLDRASGFGAAVGVALDHLSVAWY